MKQISLLAALLLGTAGPALADAFNEQALLAQARTEPPLVVYDSTGKIKEQVANFARKYGLNASGIKSKVTQTIKIVTNEARAGNVRTDVIAISDAPAAQARLRGPGHVVNYFPSDMADKVPADMQDPLIENISANVIAYNTGLNDICPISNIWALTDPEWKGRIAMQDPLGKPAYTDWFNQLQDHYDDRMAAAYRDHFGKPLDMSKGTATAQWVAGLAANQPLLTHSDSDAAQAIGAPDTKENFVGVLSTGKFRENANGMKLGICPGIEPFSGFMGAKMLFITKGAPSPAAARLFVHYMLTGEGAAPQSVDGKKSSNRDVPLPADEPSGIAAHFDQMTPYHAKTSTSDWEHRQDWQDLWAINHRG